jgi:ATP-binding cassette subfamily C (CFTR/MRP) protein 1
VHVDGDFAWETVGKPVQEGKFNAKGPGMGGRGQAPGAGNGKGDLGKGKAEKTEKTDGKRWWSRAEKDKAGKGGVLPSTANDLEDEDEDEKEKEKGEDKDKEKEKEKERPFELKNLNFTVPQGAFIGIVGRVGCGKVSLSILFYRIYMHAKQFVMFAEFSTPGSYWRNAPH